MSEDQAQALIDILQALHVEIHAWRKQLSSDLEILAVRVSHVAGP